MWDKTNQSKEYKRKQRAFFRKNQEILKQVPEVAELRGGTPLRNSELRNSGTRNSSDPFSFDTPVIFSES